MTNTRTDRVCDKLTLHYQADRKSHGHEAA